MSHTTEPNVVGVREWKSLSFSLLAFSFSHLPSFSVKWIFDVTEQLSPHIVKVLIKSFLLSSVYVSPCVQLKSGGVGSEIVYVVSHEFIITGRANSEFSKGKVFVPSKFSTVNFHHCFCSTTSLSWLASKYTKTLENRETHNFLADQSSAMLFELFMSKSKEKRRR